jgi:hypothetical protein
MHAAAMLGVLGFLGSLRGVLQVRSLVEGTAAHPNAIIAQLIMAALMLGLCRALRPLVHRGTQTQARGSLARRGAGEIIRVSMLPVPVYFAVWG